VILTAHQGSGIEPPIGCILPPPSALLTARSRDPSPEPERGKLTPLNRRTWWPLLPITIAIVLTTLAAFTAIAGLAAPDPGTVRGVRLGMTTDQVRQRFEAGAPASWRTEIAGTDLTLIRAPGGSLDREARFEFHDGMLVALRMDLPEHAPEAIGDPIWSSTATVIARSRVEPGRVRFVVLARDCPTHAEEAARILAPGS
jgi:hypothetical protein